MSLKNFLKISTITAGAALSIGGYFLYDYRKSHVPQLPEYPEIGPDIPDPHLLPLPNSANSRENKISSLETADWDLVIIGGGATGLGIALDASLRGYKTALIERGDFGSGTSSRSTKLIHGGVRYLANAVLHLDWEQFELVMEALQERATLLSIAPHLSHPLPIMLPIYDTYWKVPYFAAGLILYDLIAHLASHSNAQTKALGHTQILSPEASLSHFPYLKTDGLLASLVYSDGQHDDARMALNIALAAMNSSDHCTITNYVEAIGFDKRDGVQIKSVIARDRLTGRQFNINGNRFINATGPFSDSIRRMDQPNTPSIIYPAAGTHISLPPQYSPTGYGLLNPDTDDNRIVFVLPWLNQTIAGTTDHLVDDPIELPTPTDEEIEFIIHSLNPYLSEENNVSIDDIQSSWCGIRPLARSIDKALSGDTISSKDISRTHVIFDSFSGLTTVAGGKWTTYRRIAQDAVDHVFPESSNKCTTHTFPLYGASGWSLDFQERFSQKYNHLNTNLSDRLSASYGVHAPRVLLYQDQNNVENPQYPTLHENTDILEAEVKYSVSEEMTETLVDFIARRNRIAFLDTQGAVDTLPRLLSIMSDLKSWDSSRITDEVDNVLAFLSTFDKNLTADKTLLIKQSLLSLAGIESGNTTTLVMEKSSELEMDADSSHESLTPS